MFMTLQNIVPYCMPTFTILCHHSYCLSFPLSVMFCLSFTIDCHLPFPPISHCLSSSYLVYTGYVISNLSVVLHCMSFTIACNSPLSDISHCLSFPSICHSLLSVIPPLSAIPIICPSPLCYFSFSCHFPLSIIANCLLFTLSVIMLIYISLEPWTCSKHVVIT